MIAERIAREGSDAGGWACGGPGRVCLGTKAPIVVLADAALKFSHAWRISQTPLLRALALSRHRRHRVMLDVPASSPYFNTGVLCAGSAFYPYPWLMPS